MWRIRRGSAAARRGRCSQEYGRHRHRRTTQFEQPNQPCAEPGLFIAITDAADRWRPDRGTAPTLPREDTTSPTPPRFWAASAVDGSNPPRVVPAPTRGLGYVNGLSRAGGGHSHPPQAARRAMRIFGHASGALATPAAFRARFVGDFWRSAGERVRCL